MMRTKNKSRFTDNYSSYSTPFAKESLDVTLEEFLDTEEPRFIEWCSISIHCRFTHYRGASTSSNRY